MVAAPWIAVASLCELDGRLDTEYLWADLDCAGYFVIEDRVALATLGRMTARIDAHPRVGDTVIVSGWPIASEGRKHKVGTAIHDVDGRLIASAAGLGLHWRSEGFRSMGPEVARIGSKPPQQKGGDHQHSGG